MFRTAVLTWLGLSSVRLTDLQLGQLTGTSNPEGPLDYYPMGET